MYISDNSWCRTYDRLDPNGVPKNKPGLLAASFLTGTFGAAFMLLLAWNAPYAPRFLSFAHSLT